MSGSRDDTSRRRGERGAVKAEVMFIGELLEHHIGTTQVNSPPGAVP